MKEEAKQKTIQIISGEYFVSSSPNEVLMTILGSCISVCAPDPLLKIGGMNHFLLPGDNNNQYSTRFGLYAMEKLFNELFKLGASKERLQLKVFGGANMTNSSALIGDRNVIFIEDFLRKDGYKIAARDVGGTEARRLKFYPYLGKVMMKKVNETDTKELITKEAIYHKNIVTTPDEGEIDLF